MHPHGAPATDRPSAAGRFIQTTLFVGNIPAHQHVAMGGKVDP